jgi:hypothetical protein
MTKNPHLIALNAHLSVGTRSARALARETTTDPKVAADELLKFGAAALADVRRDALAETRADAARAVEATANVERLAGEQTAYVRRRDDLDGPFHADRFWLGTLVALLIVVTVLLIGAALVIHGFTGTRADALVVLALATAVATAAGDWGGRARERRARLGAAALVGVAMLAAFAVGALHDSPTILFSVDLAVILPGAGAGYLVGRGRWVVPRLRAAEQEHTVEIEIAYAQPAVRRTAEEIAADEAEYAATVDQIATRVLRAVEEYLRRVGDSLADSGRFDDVRHHAREVVDTWPRELGLAAR